MLVLPESLTIILALIAIFLLVFILFLAYYLIKNKKENKSSGILDETIVGVINVKKSEVEVIIGKSSFLKSKFSVEEFCENFGLLISEIQDFSVIKSEEPEMQFYRKNLIGQMNLDVPKDKRLFFGAKKKTYSITLFSSIDGITKFTITGFVKRKNLSDPEKNSFSDTEKYLAKYENQNQKKYLCVFAIKPLFGEFYSEMIDDRILLEIQNQLFLYLKRSIRHKSISFVSTFKGNNFEYYGFLATDTYEEVEIKNLVKEIEAGVNKFHKSFEGSQFSLTVNVGIASVERTKLLSQEQTFDIINKAHFSVFKALNSSLKYYIFNEKQDTKFYEDNFKNVSLLFLNKRSFEHLTISFLPIIELTGEVYGWEPIIYIEKENINISLTNLLRTFLFSSYDEAKYVELLTKIVLEAKEQNILNSKKPVFIPFIIGEENLFEEFLKNTKKKFEDFDINNFSISLIKNSNFQHRKLLHSLHYFQKLTCRCGLAVETILSSELLVTPIDFHHIVLSPWIAGNKIPNYRELLAIKQITTTNSKTPLLFFGYLNSVNFNIIKTYGVSFYANLSMNLPLKDILFSTTKERKEILDKLALNQKVDGLAHATK